MLLLKITLINQYNRSWSLDSSFCFVNSVLSWCYMEFRLKLLTWCYLYFHFIKKSKKILPCRMKDPLQCKLIYLYQNETSWNSKYTIWTLQLVYGNLVYFEGLNCGKTSSQKNMLSKKKGKEIQGARVRGLWKNRVSGYILTKQFPLAWVPT